MHIPWTPAFRDLPMRRVDARTCPDCEVSYMLGWAGLDYRIRRIVRGHREIGVFDTPTPTDRAQVEKWWELLLAGEAI